MKKKELEKIANNVPGVSPEDRLYGTSDVYFSTKHRVLNSVNERNNQNVNKEKIKL